MESGKLDWQPIINIGATAILGLIGWFVKGIKDDQRNIERDLGAFRVEVARDYITHADVSDIKDSLRRIEDKLDRKVDK